MVSDVNEPGQCMPRLCLHNIVYGHASGNRNCLQCRINKKGPMDLFS